MPITCEHGYLYGYCTVITCPFNPNYVPIPPVPPPPDPIYCIHGYTSGGCVYPDCPFWDGVSNVPIPDPEPEGIDFKWDQVTNVREIESFQTNKIRIFMNAIAQKDGFPVRLHHTVAFFDLIMFSIPFYTKLMIFQSIEAWEGRYSPMGQGPELIHDPSEIHRYRNVIIFDIPNELLSMILMAIPTFIDNMLVELAMQTTHRPWPIFENLVTFSGMSNLFIKYNWDKILLVLNQNGY